MYIKFNEEVLNENKNLEKYVHDLVLKQASKANSEVVNTGNPSSNSTPSQPSEEEVLEATKLLCATLVKAFVGYFIIMFVDAKLSKFAVNTIKRNQENKPLFDFISKEVEAVYRKHRDYTPCSGEQFKKTSIFNYMLAEWRDKTAKENSCTWIRSAIYSDKNDA